MGQVADDMLDGLACSICGMYFETEHGYPVICKDCWADYTPEERKASSLQEASFDTIG